MLFNNLELSAPNLASIVYLISKKFADASKLADKGSLSARDKRELIANP
jgi:hypothetical protein